jgi:hypothetical protein
MTERSPDREARWTQLALESSKQSAREPPPCLNTKEFAGEKHYLSDCPHTGKDESIVLLSELVCRRDQCSRNSYVDDSSCLISE